MNKPSNIIRGCWQLAAGHSQKTLNLEPILDAIESGFNTFDCADIYSGVEELLGKATASSGKTLRIHTKFVPDLDCLQTLDRAYVDNIIHRSLTRLQVGCLDLVQFHWWNWEVERYFHAMDLLSQLKAEGKIAQIGLTNVNKHYLQAFSERFDIASLQTQVSLFDRRTERGIGDLCRQKNIRIYAYGTLLGGFLSEKWLGMAEPQQEQLENRSLVKYKLLIDSACGWSEYQRRLSILNDMAGKYRCDIASIAIAGVLQQGRADAVIVGLSPQNFAMQNHSLLKIPHLTDQDLQRFDTWTCHLQGDAYDAERDETSQHAKVMKYNLNQVA